MHKCKCKCSVSCTDQSFCFIILKYITRSHSYSFLCCLICLFSLSKWLHFINHQRPQFQLKVFFTVLLKSPTSWTAWGWENEQFILHWGCKFVNQTHLIYWFIGVFVVQGLNWRSNRSLFPVLLHKYRSFWLIIWISWLMNGIYTEVNIDNLLKSCFVVLIRPCEAFLYPSSAQSMHFSVRHTPPSVVIIHNNSPVKDAVNRPSITVTADTKTNKSIWAFHFDLERGAIECEHTNGSAEKVH